MKRALIVRNGTSGRFSPIAAILGETGWTGAVINGPVGTDIAGWINLRWTATAPIDPAAHRGAVQFRDAMLCAQAAAGAAQRLKNDGFVPDVIIGHPAWGEMLLLSEIFPGVPQIQIGEFYFRANGGHVNFDPEFPVPRTGRTVAIAQNAVLAASYAEAAAIVAPTPFQASQLPADFAAKTAVIHEGVDTARTRRRPSARIVLPGGVVLDGSVPAISFVNRRFEPIRGFHVFMRMLPALLERVPDLHVVLVGADEPEQTYGARPGTSRCWREALLTELSGQLDMRRVHFLRPIPHEHLQALFAAVRAHVYLTYPFVLSWSLLDAMACETLVVASNTAPVRDVVAHGRNGVLVDFFDRDAMAETLAQVCRAPAAYDPLRTAARQTVVREFDRHMICMPAWRQLVERVAAGAIAPCALDRSR